jgi:ATP-binding cassette subfamily B protein
LSTLRKANRLVVLDRGQVVEVGDHETLMEREGAYFRLYQAQVRQGDESDEVSRHKVWRDEDSDG